MKKVILALILFTLFGCTTVRVTMGMPENDFTNRYKSAEVVLYSKERDVYKMILYVNGQSKAKYFYFSDGKLYQVDDGVPRPDIIFQNNTN